MVWVGLLMIGVAELQAAAPDTPAATEVACQLHAEGRSVSLRGPRRLSVSCPSDVVDAHQLQAAADAAVAAVDLNLRYRRRLSYSAAETVRFRYEDGRWRPLLGQIIVSREFNVPTISNLPANWMVCSAALEPGNDGAPIDPAAFCTSDNADARLTDRMQEALLEAIANTRLLPVDQAYCLNQSYVGRVEIHAPLSGARWEGGGEMPDPDALPTLCG